MKTLSNRSGDEWSDRTKFEGNRADAQFSEIDEWRLERSAVCLLVCVKLFLSWWPVRSNPAAFRYAGYGQNSMMFYHLVRENVHCIVIVIVLLIGKYAKEIGAQSPG